MSLFKALDCLSWVQRSKRKLFESIWKKYYPDGDIEDDKAIVSEFQKLVDDSLEMIELHKNILHGELSVDWIRTVIRYDLYIMMFTLFVTHSLWFIDFDSNFEFQSHFSHSPELSVVTNSLYMLHLKKWLKAGFKKGKVSDRHISLWSKTTSILLVNTEGMLIYSGKAAEETMNFFGSNFG